MRMPSDLSDGDLTANFLKVLASMAETGCDLLDGVAELTEADTLDNLHAALAVGDFMPGHLEKGQADPMIDQAEDHELQEYMAALLHEVDQRSFSLLPAAAASLPDYIRETAFLALDRWMEAQPAGPEL